VLWRVNTLERVISFAVAKKTGKWYQSKIESVSKEEKAKKLKLDIKEIMTLIGHQEQHWINTMKNWPLGITPSFITYEELFPDYLPVIKSKIYSCLGVEAQGWEEPSSLKQSDATPYKEKVNLPLYEHPSNTYLLFRSIIF